MFRKEADDSATREAQQQVLARLDAKFGTDYLRQTELNHYADQVIKSRIQGSRGAQVGEAIGETVGSAANSLGLGDKFAKIMRDTIKLGRLASEESPQAVMGLTSNLVAAFSNLYQKTPNGIKPAVAALRQMIAASREAANPIPAMALRMVYKEHPDLRAFIDREQAAMQSNEQQYRFNTLNEVDRRH
jgi:hypothetical protein